MESFYSDHYSSDTKKILNLFAAPILLYVFDLRVDAIFTLN
jgi:hypothetical protein